MICPHCGKSTAIKRGSYVMNAKRRIMAIIRQSSGPVPAHVIAAKVYGQDTPRTRNNVHIHVNELNAGRKVIGKAGRGRASQGYVLADAPEHGAGPASAPAGL